MSTFVVAYSLDAIDSTPERVNYLRNICEAAHHCYMGLSDKNWSYTQSLDRKQNNHNLLAGGFLVLPELDHHSAPSKPVKTRVETADQGTKAAEFNPGKIYVLTSN